MTTRAWLIYGAYGYTGELIAREAVRQGLRPTLAGRRPGPLQALAQELELPCRAFDLEDRQALSAALKETAAVLHCAGPFIATSRNMVEACLACGSHYLDITGEIGVFESIFRHDRAAREAGIALVPGTGLDVVPTDCLALHLAGQLQRPTHLELALHTDRGAASRGTLSTMIEALPHVGAERVDGELVTRPPAFDAREIEFSTGRRWTMTIPWGDLSTAFRSTGIPNIRVYMSASPRRIARLRRLAPLLPLLGNRGIKTALKWAIRRRVTGPSAEIRRTARTHFWGSVHTRSGEARTATLDAPEGYQLTALTAVECAKRVLAGEVSPGSWTPATAFGVDFIKTFDGVSTSW